MMTKRLLSDLKTIDFLEKEVWECLTVDNIEYVKPAAINEIHENSNTAYIVLTEYILNNKSKFLGFCSPQDTSGIDYIQPVIFTDKGQVAFYKEREWSYEEIDFEMKKFGLEKHEIFPIELRTRIKCDGKFCIMTLEDFNKLK